MPAASSPSGPAVARVAGCVALTGNPNCGKTTIFNALTGLRAKVGNYAGVTVERKEGRLQGAGADCAITLLDLPGTYSLSPQSLDEQIARDVLFQRLPDVAAPVAVVVVVDASNLERNLYYATQAIELGYPTVLALNMVDVAADQGRTLDATALSQALGVPVVPMVANASEGVAALRQAIVAASRVRRDGPPPSLIELPAAAATEVDALAVLLERERAALAVAARAEALLLLTDAKVWHAVAQSYPSAIRAEVAAARQRLEAAGLDWRSLAIEARYAAVAAIQERVTVQAGGQGESWSDRIDRVVTHKLWGTLIFVGVMGLMFQTIFSFARIPMDALQRLVGWIGSAVGGALPPGDLNSLLVDGVVAGVGAVVVFLPQILLLFLFIGFLEDTGYMARAAFLMDRLMSKVGLHGKSFIPMLSSFACAIPGIMATRTIESPKDRLATILIAPLMSCSARLPVYTLLIGACIPDVRVLGAFKLTGLTLLAMYLLGIVSALGMAWLFKKTLLRSEAPLLIMELPPYKRPLGRVVLRHMWDRSRLFLRRAGTVILGINILLWFLASYPRDADIAQRYDAQRRQAEAARATMPAGATAAQVEAARADQLSRLAAAESGERLRASFAGWLGRAVEPVIAPIGFDWTIGIGIVMSFAAREVFVSTMSTVYNVGGGQRSEADPPGLARTLREQRRPDGRPLYTPLTAVTLMVFYVFALQCVSTVAIVRRETNSWWWPFFQWAYMGILAWTMAFATLHLGRLLGFE